jgi:protein-export SecD/SecF family membrane protein
MKKGKSALILLLIIAITCGLGAVAYFGIGTVKKDTADSSQQMVQLVTDENGEPVTDENGQYQFEAVTSDTEDDDTSAAAFGYGSAFNIKQGLDLKGGVSILYRAEKENPTDDEMSAAIAMIQERLDANMWTEAECSKEGINKIRVDIPGVEDADAAAESIGETAHLTFRADPDGDILVDGMNVKDATVQTQNGEVVVELQFDSVGTKAFAEATQQCIGSPLYIMMDERTISSPNVNTAITTGNAVITGNFTTEEAKALADKIRAGSLPFNLSIDQKSSIGARLGADSLQRTLEAGVIGVIAVFIFMLIIYRAAGFAADLALIIYTMVDLIIMSLFGVTLTLPGIAGVVLSIGMAVDANVLIFERVREELGEGKTITNAFRNGFSRAMPAIIDSNVTTIIASIVLLWYGSGSVIGFAQTLIIGVILSMFTAIFVTRYIVEALIGLGIKNPKLYGAK